MKQTVSIRKREEKRLGRGHLWVFSNEIERIDGSPATGDIVDVLRHDGAFIGRGFYHPHSLIAVRLLAREEDEQIDDAFFRRRITAALDFRQSLYPGEEAYRLLHGESDGLPGLLIDVYGKANVLQILSAGMDRRSDMIVRILRELLEPDLIVARNDSPLRTLEGLPSESAVLAGEPASVVISEHGILYEVDVVGGQKTGMFLDQKDNRSAVRRYLKDRRVLDCFSNSGGFALNAAAGGARGVSAVDASAESVELARRNFDRNGLKADHLVCADVFEHLALLRDASERFGGIILDPPAFTKNKRSVVTALKAYRKLNMLALRVLEPNGILVTASCSHHITRDDFLTMVAESAHRTGRTIRFLEIRGAAADHPVLPAMPETEYLKLAICSVA